MSSTVNTTEEDELLEAVKEASDLVDEGKEPSEAIEKVSRDRSFGPGRIRLLCFAHNTGRQLGQWRREDDVLSKLAEFPTADPDTIIGRIFGEQEKTADVAECYDEPPAWPMQREKTASVVLCPPPSPYAKDPAHALNKAYGNVTRHKRACDELSRTAAAAEDTVRSLVADLTGYFRKSASDRLTFADFESTARAYFGKLAAPLLDCVYCSARLKEKRASAGTVAGGPSNLGREPYDTFGRCLVVAREACNARDAHQRAVEKTAAVREESLRPFAPSPPIKQAALGAPIGAAVGTMLSRGLGGMPKTKDDLIDDAMQDLDDPQHQNEIRKIQAQAMLNSMLTDPDDPISGFDPDQVLAAFNEISQMTPRLAEQPAALKPILRRRLQGHVEPFEAKEQADIETSLMRARAPEKKESLLDNVS